MDISEQERQLIEIIREQSGEDDLRISLWFGDGLWRVSMDVAADGKATGGYGAGENFDRAWDDLAPAGLKGPALRVVSSENRDAEVLTIVRRVLKAVVAVNSNASDDVLVRDLTGGVLVELSDVTGIEIKRAMKTIADEK